MVPIECECWFTVLPLLQISDCISDFLHRAAFWFLLFHFVEWHNASIFKMTVGSGGYQSTGYVETFEGLWSHGCLLYHSCDRPHSFVYFCIPDTCPSNPQHPPVPIHAPWNWGSTFPWNVGTNPVTVRSKIPKHGYLSNENHSDVQKVYIYFICYLIWTWIYCDR